MVLEELVAVLGWDLRGEEDLRRFKAGMRDAEANLSAFVSRASAMVTAIGVAVGAGMAAVGKSVLETGMEFEKLGLQLEILEGSADKAADRMEWLRKFAIETPLNLQQATDAYIRMKNFGLDPLDGSMQSIVDANALMGGSTERLSGIILALGQAWTKQKFQAEEANQLLERGIPAWELMSQATGKTTAELMELSEKGKIGRKEIRLLIEQMGERAKGASERFAKTMEGQIGKLDDMWISFKKKIADAGFYRDVQDRLSDLMSYIDRLDKNGSLNKWAVRISNGLSTALDGAVKVASRVIHHFEKLSAWISDHANIWDHLKTGLMVIAAVKFPAGAAILVIEDFLTALEGGDSVIGDFGKALQRFAEGDFSDVSDDLEKLAKGAAGLGIAAVAIRGFTSSLWPLAAALGAVGVAFYLAKGFFEKLEEDAAKVKVVENPRTKPGYVEGSGEDRTGFNSDNPNGYLKPSDFSADFEAEKQRLIEEEARRVGADKAVPRKPTAFERLGGDYIRSDMIENAQGNFGKTGAAQAAQSVNSTVNNTLNDSSDKSVSVTVNQTVQAATQAPGAAAQATGNAVAGAAARAKRSTWWEQGEKF